MAPQLGCKVCGDTVDFSGRCRVCGISGDLTTELPPFHADSEISSGGNRQFAVNLHSHPGTPRDFHIAENSPLTLCPRDIKYRGVLSDDTSLFLWCPADQNTLFIRHFSQSALLSQSEITICGVPCTFGQLRPGDLLTIGSYAWVFHAYAKGHGFGLEFSNPLKGASVEFFNVKVGHRLDIPQLKIDAGQFVGIVGKSGAGKSTLIREMVETRCGSGEVRIDGCSRDSHCDPAMEKIAYVPQMDVVYDDLTVFQQTIDYVHLINSSTKRDVIDESLRVVGLRDLETRYPSQLSGGQLRRSRLAAALARRPRVLLLDEPDSGLDPETATGVRRLLRTFSMLGATVITVTHHHYGLDQFTRVIEIGNGKVVRDSKPETSFPVDTDTADNSSAAQGSLPLRQFAQVYSREWRQFTQRVFLKTNVHLLGERLSQLLSGRLRDFRFQIPQWFFVGLIVPGLFGVAIGLAAPIEKQNLQPDLIGFLCVLSVIWMAASHSHLALTINWYRTQYELAQGLCRYPFIAAKSAFLLTVTTFQTSVFFMVLWVTRHSWLHQPVFYGHIVEEKGTTTIRLGQAFFTNLDSHAFGVLLTLLTVGAAASQLGLLMSVLAKWRTLAVASILPLVMMFQIVFSPFVVCASKNKETLEATYAGNWWQEECEGIHGCPARMLKYQPEFGFVCDECSQKLKRQATKLEEESKNRTDALSDPAAIERERKERSEALVNTVLTCKEIDNRIKNEAGEDIPLRWATVASYGTFTRFADIALRPVIKQSQSDEHEIEFGYAELRHSALLRLIVLAVAFHVLVVVFFGCIAPHSILRRIRLRIAGKGAA